MMIKVNGPSLRGRAPVSWQHRWNHGPRPGDRIPHSRTEPGVVSVERCSSPTSLAEVRRETSRGGYPTREGRLARIGPVGGNGDLTAVAQEAPLFTRGSDHSARYSQRTDKPMTATCRFALVLSVVLALHPNRASAEDLRWRDAASFEIEGRGWVKTAGPYDRLPDSARNKVSKTAWDLSKETSGVCIRSVTDAAVVSVRWSVTSGSLAMPHMAATGVSGVDLYARSADDSWRFVGNGRPHKQDGNLGKFELPEGGRAGRECRMYRRGAGFRRARERRPSRLAPPLVKRFEQQGLDLQGRCGLRGNGKVFAEGAQTERPGVAWPVRKLPGRKASREQAASRVNHSTHDAGESDPRLSAVPALASQAWTSAQSCLHDSCSAADKWATAVASRRPANAGSDCQFRSHT
jgi:hypothetical protein